MWNTICFYSFLNSCTVVSILFTTPSNRSAKLHIVDDKNDAVPTMAPNPFWIGKEKKPGKELIKWLQPVLRPYVLELSNTGNVITNIVQHTIHNGRAERIDCCCVLIGRHKGDTKPVFVCVYSYTPNERTHYGRITHLPYVCVFTSTTAKLSKPLDGWYDKNKTVYVETKKTLFVIARV